MPGRFAGPFNLFRDSNTKERLVKNYAAKLLANVERIVDRPGGSKFQKLVSQHGDLLFTAMVDKTGPRPIRRVLVTGLEFDVVEQEVVEREVALFVFESGLLLGQTAYLAALEDAYFAGGGTVFMPENVQHHIQGKYLFPSPTPDWATITPSHDVTDTKYVTQGHTQSISSAYANASMFTGLLRLAVQGKFGLGTQAISDGVVSELFPWGDIEPYQDGIVRAPDYTYFAIRVDDTGCKACLMEHNSIVTDLVARLVAGTFSEEDAKKAEAVVLALLTPVRDAEGELVETTLLSASEVTPVEDPPISFPLAYGWHFSYPDLTECAIIRHGTEYFDVGECPSSPAYPGVQYTAYKSVISFTFSRASENDPYEIAAAIATDSVGTVWWNYPDITTIWHPTSDHTRIQSFWSRQCETDEVSAPIYCWYDETGYRDVWINIEVSTDTEIHIPPLGERSSCTYMYAEPTISLLNLGGYVRAEYTLDGASSGAVAELVNEGTSAVTWEYNIEPLSNSYDEHVSTIDATEMDINTGVVSSGKNFQGTCPGLMRDPGDTYWHRYFYDPDTWKIWHKIYNRQVELSEYIPFFCTALVIPRLNSEGVFIATRRAKTQTVERNYFDEREDSDGEDYILVGYAKHVSAISTEYYHGAFNVTQGAYTSIGRGYVIAAGTKSTGDYPGRIWSNRYIANLKVEDLSPVEERVNTAELITSAGEVDLQEEQDDRWDGYFNKDWNNGFDAIHFSTPASYGGNMKYPTEGHTPSNPVLLGNYTAEAEVIEAISFESSPVYWIGWS